jgi:hypothetical protein
MGLDSIIEKDPEWKCSTNYIIIKNNIGKTFKEINDSLNKSIDDMKSKGLTMEDICIKINPNYKIILERNKRIKIEERKKYRSKINNNNY